MTDKKQKWLLTHDSHELKKGDMFEGVTLPAWLNGKVTPLSADSFEVATPGGAELEKLKAELAAQTQRADEAEASLTQAKADHIAELAAEAKRADEAIAALAEATKKVK